MTGHGSKITIWFFIGALLFVYGVLIVGAEMFTEPAQPVVLGEYHFGYWMGALLIVLGAYYCIHFRPRKD